MTMQADIQKEKEDFYRKISNEYASKSVISNNIGTTTDEILCYYIDKYKETGVFLFGDKFGEF